MLVTKINFNGTNSTTSSYDSQLTDTTSDDTLLPAIPRANPPKLSGNMAIFGNSEIKVSPKPVLGVISMEFGVIRQCKYQIVIVDGEGKTIYSKTGDVKPVNNNLIVDISRYASGIYFLKLSAEGETKAIKVLKQ